MDAKLNGARIHYERSGGGFPVIFLHAGIADSRMWEPQVATFARHFDVIRPDLRGFGDSELPATSWSPVADLLALMDELDLKPVHLVGCSIGGGLAIDFALSHPARVSKLVLVGAGVGGMDFGSKYPHLYLEVDAAEKAGDIAGVNEAAMYLWLDGPGRPRGYVRQPLRDLFLDMNGRSLRSNFDAAPVQRMEPPAATRLAELTAPALIIVGDEDLPAIMDTADLLMASVTHARRAVIHDAAHLPNLEHPEEFNRLVLDFLLEDPAES